MKKHLSLFLVGLLAWFVPTFASAQPLAPGEFRQLRSDDPECGEGFTCFQVGPYRPESGPLFDRMLRVVNRGVEDESRHITIAQLEAANPCGVRYFAPGRRYTVNGTCSANGTTERVTFAEFCEGASGCVRWAFVGRVYRVPSVRILTPDERAEEMAREIENAVVTETVPAPSTLGANLRELIELRNSDQPPSDAHEAAVLTAMANALDRSSASAPAEAPADMVFDHAETVTDPEESDALAVANTRIAELEAELAARPVAAGNLGHWIAIVILSLVALGLLLYLFFSPRHKVIEDLSDAERARERTNAKKAFERELGGSIAETKSKLEQRQADQTELDNAKSGLAAIREIFEKNTGIRHATVNDIGKWMKEAHDFVFLWKAHLSKTTPIELRDERTQAVKYRQLDEAWKSVEGFKLSLTIANTEKVIKDWVRFMQLQTEWAGLVPAYAVTESPDGGLLDYVQMRNREASRAIIEQRDGFEAQANEQAALFRKEREASDRLSTQFEDILESLNVVTRGEFGSILMRVGLERVIDPERVRNRFSKMRKFEGPKQRGKAREAIVVHELQSLALCDFLRTTIDGLNKVGDIACEALGRKPVVDNTPAPGTVSVPSPATLAIAPESAEELGSEESDEGSWDDEPSASVGPDPEALRQGIAPAAPQVPQIEGLATDSLLDHPVEAETVQSLRPDSMHAALAAAVEFSRTRTDDASSEDEDALEREVTGIGLPPLAPDPTQPFSRPPIEGSHASSGNGHGVNGKRRPPSDNEVTRQVDLREDGRPRRITERGMAVVQVESKPPEARPPTEPTSAEE